MIGSCMAASSESESESGFKGLMLDPRNQKHQLRVSILGKRTSLGFYPKGADQKLASLRPQGRAPLRRFEDPLSKDRQRAAGAAAGLHHAAQPHSPPHPAPSGGRQSPSEDGQLEGSGREGQETAAPDLQTVEDAAMLYDCLQLLLHGPRADTNFEWSSYCKADVEAAVEVLKRKGVDVHAAVVAAREGQGAGEWTGVYQKGASWFAHVSCRVQGGDRKQITIDWPRASSAEAAAPQADCGLLAVQGLQATTNFPASTYSKLQLEEAGECFISKGADAGRIRANLGAVEQVSALAGFPSRTWHYAHVLGNLHKG
jgi:hypothetical protein